MSLTEVRDRMLRDENLSPKMRAAIESFAKNPKRPLGKLNPWTWWPELVRGCNLSCVFCPARMIEKSDWNFMSSATFEHTLSLMAELAPYGRMNFAMLGEPTLHPLLLDFVRLTRERATHVQITTYTNGKRLVSGEVTYKSLFDAGINCVFTDMYDAFEVHKRLAIESGYEWYHEDEKPDDIANVFEYRDEPDRHTIRLSENPYSWNKRKMGRGEFHTFLNTLDWDAAKKFDITPVVDPPKRRCDQPSKFVNINWDGSYQVCCAAGMSSSATTKLGNVSEGLDGFLRFWLGGYMQDVRLYVENKDRAGHELCAKCSFVSIRSDIPYWKGGFSEYWDGSAWRTLAPYVPSGSQTAGELKRMRLTPSSREREIAKNDPQKALFDVSVGKLGGKKS